MNWAVAKIWAADLSLVDAVNNITYDNWRLPTVIDTGTPGCNFANTGTDCGSNVDTATGEMAHLFYDELGNKAYYGTSGNPQSGFGLTNTGPFTHLQAGNYWSGSEAASEAGPYSGSAWLFDFGFGHQGTEFTQSAFYYSHLYDYYALAVSPGDVGAVPEAQTYALMLAGLGLIGWRARRRG